MAREKWIPYFMTTSLRKIIDSLRTHSNDIKITVAQGAAERGSRDKKEFHTDVGLTIWEQAQAKAELDYRGSGLWLDRMESRLDELESHDMSVQFLRLRIEGDGEFVDSLKGRWDRNEPSLSRGEFEIKDGTLSPGGHFYLDIKNKKPEFNIDDYNVKSNISWRKHWESLNGCEVCDAPLLAHGFNHRYLEVAGLESEEINESIPRNRRPNFNLDFQKRSSIPSWISENVIKPTGYHSPNTLLYFKKDKEERWMLEDV